MKTETIQVTLDTSQVTVMLKKLTAQLQKATTSLTELKYTLQEAGDFDSLEHRYPERSGRRGLNEY